MTVILRLSTRPLVRAALIRGYGCKRPQVARHSQQTQGYISLNDPLHLMYIRCKGSLKFLLRTKPRFIQRGSLGLISLMSQLSLLQGDHSRQFLPLLA